MAAVADVAKAKGITAVAEEAGLGRESLYKVLPRSAQPRFETVKRLRHALGVDIEIVPRTRAG